MIQQIAHPETKVWQSNWLYKASAAAALTAGGLLLAAAIGLTLTVFQLGITSKWLILLQNNWLVVIFKLHADFRDIQSSLLYQINMLDLVILALTATMYMGLYGVLRKNSKVWPLIALAQSVLGIVLFLITKSAGRSSVMGAELVISLIMLRSKLFNKRIAYTGVLSAVLLLAGDLGASMAPSTILAIIMGIGYMLLVTWLFLVARRLLQIGQQKELE